LKILSGWKEIARHLRRGVRTVQRWEKLGLPVHRPNGERRSAVSGLAHELDAWMTETPLTRFSAAELHAEVEALRAENEFLRSQLTVSNAASARGQSASE
jgi:phage terminase Nu1 subunit (DNA packaging protein)